MMAKKPMGKPEVIAPVKSKAKPEIISPAPAPAPSAISTKAAEEAELVSLKKQIAEIATQTGQKVDPRTGQIIIDEAAIGKKFGVTPVSTTTVTPVNAAEAAEALRLEQERKAQVAADLRDRQSAYDILFNEFSAYGLGGLVEDVKYLLQSDVSPSQFALELKNTKSYKDRFAANENRIKSGLRALSPAEYIGLEDQYQEIMRNYGLPAAYYTKDGTGKQVGFEKFIAGDVSAVELEDRIGTAQKRVLYANPEVSAALKQFYPDISNGDILAYTLDPTKGLEDIKRKVTAAEIGGAAMTPKNAAGQQILTTSEARAMQLAGYGVDKAQATQGYSAIGSGLQRGSELASIYGQSPYTQTTAEEEVFKLSGQTEAEKQRKKITGLEKAAFGGQTGLTSGALARDRAGGY
jgi:hypothetical protein